VNISIGKEAKAMEAPRVSTTPQRKGKGTGETDITKLHVVEDTFSKVRWIRS